MNPFARRQARRYATQALYQWEMCEYDMNEVIREFELINPPIKNDDEYWRNILFGVESRTEELDRIIEPALDRKLEELNPIEKNILRLAVFEFIACEEVPYKVVINEAIELAKTYGATDGHKYVNGVLDQIARDLEKMPAREVNLNAIRVNKSKVNQPSPGATIKHKRKTLSLKRNKQPEREVAPKPPVPETDQKAFEALKVLQKDHLRPAPDSDSES